jgi:hypothetical protein
VNWRITRQFVFVLSLLTFLLSHGTVEAQKFTPSKAKKSSTSATVESTILQAGAAAGLALIQKEEEIKLQQTSAKKPEAL